MKNLIAPCLAATLLSYCYSCKVSEKESNDLETQAETDVPFEELDPNRTPKDFVFKEKSTCDTLTNSQLEEMSLAGEMLNLSVDVSDSIHVRYHYAAGGYNFFDGHYKVENDTLFVWDTGGSWEDIDTYCIFHLHFVLPKPNTDKAIIKINDEVREVSLSE
ncbi:MAG: hypothetical protein HUJ25_05645 [Crocinitomicaceae bacterium]|nr:hypothetical protein [Crocinitomicaceae bacterium]